MGVGQAPVRVGEAPYLGEVSRAPHPQAVMGSWLPAGATLTAQTLQPAWSTGEAALGFVWPLSPAELGAGGGDSGQ